MWKIPIGKDCNWQWTKTGQNNITNDFKSMPFLNYPLASKFGCEIRTANVSLLEPHSCRGPATDMRTLRRNRSALVLTNLKPATPTDGPTIASRSRTAREPKTTEGFHPWARACTSWTSNTYKINNSCFNPRRPSDQWELFKETRDDVLC